ncbi:charged multivesicular body protein 3-like [Dysidea avara]|uniref:charged multivesicular body protein 3-like n=1 Tax=Dysidea avara TaxID=196820 RepID=UPI00331ED9F3
MPLFGEKKKDPKEQVREWKHSLRSEQRKMDRQINSIQREEAKVKLSLKDAAKKNQIDVCKILAKEVVQSRKAVNKLYASKAQINSVMMSMDQQLSMLRMSGALAKSTDVMKTMNHLVRVPEIQATMRDLSKEMTKAGIMEELIEDTFESMEDDDLEEDADSEIEKILFEVTKGQLGGVGDIGTTLPVDDTPEVDDQEDDELRARLAKLTN